MSGTETELKLALPAAQPALLAQRLARSPVLARVAPTRQRVYSLYHDTPALDLLQQRVALRLRREEGAGGARWLQTLKTAGRADSALSQRGEWETPVAGAALELRQLGASPWPRIDPDGRIAAALQPCFATDFERTCWTVRQRDGSVVEVALDIGAVVAGGRRLPLCELEFELLEGRPEALFALAQRIARHVAVLPLAASKAARGYALLSPLPPAAVAARPPALSRRMPLPRIAGLVLGEAFLQFTANLEALLQGAEDPECVHQARVGWRRFRSLARLLRPGLAQPLPDVSALAPLMQALGALRDLDVARTQTLPAWGPRYIDGAPDPDPTRSAERAAHWQALLAAIEPAARRARHGALTALAQPAAGRALLALQAWLHAVESDPAKALPLRNGGGEMGAREWLRVRTERLAKRLDQALHAGTEPEAQHRARILAKRLRYGTEALGDLLPGRLLRRQRAAAALQARLGAARDLAQAAAVAADLKAPAGVVQFLRGVAVGQAEQGHGV